MAYPTYKLFWLNKWFPRLWIPLELITLLFFHTGNSTNKEDSLIIITFINFNKSQNKDISITTDNTLDG